MLVEVSPSRPALAFGGHAFPTKPILVDFDQLGDQAQHLLYVSEVLRPTDGGCVQVKKNQSEPCSLTSLL